MSDSDRLRLNDLLERVKSGETLTSQTASRVAAALDDPSYRANRYTLLHILGRGFRIEYRSLMGGYLREGTDPLLASIALKSLTSYWGFTVEYLDALKSFARGAAWDEEGQVRIPAISELGEYARKTGDREVVRLLLDIVDDAEEDEVDRDMALAAVARALGHEYSRMPSAARVEPTDSPWSLAVRAEAAAFLASAI